MVTPRKIFLFGLSVLTVILVISAVFPGGMQAGRWTFRYPDYRTWLKPDNGIAYKDIQAILAAVDTTDYPFETVVFHGNDSTDNVTAGDTAILKPDSLQRTSIEIINTDAHLFEFPQGQDTLLFPLFRAFNNLHRRDMPLRILHYGDSQIEGDRITATIRNYMQRNHGGQGIGFLPVVPVANVAVTFQQDVSPNWKRFSVLDRNNSASVDYNRFGIAGNLVRYIPDNDSDSIARIGLLPFYGGFRNVRNFTHARLFYGQAVDSFTIIVNNAHTQRMPAKETVSSAWWQFDTLQNSLHLLLTSSSLPDLYGIALDGANGVAVDNLPLRGSSGIDLSRMDTAQIRQMFHMMDVEMLILQFGANVMTTFGDNPGYYARRFTQELQMLKVLKPGLVILVVGVNDMSQNSPDGYRSYPNIVNLRDAQKKAAFDAGCVFWDLYEAMGGENSMPGWVFANPPLAQKDFVHFSIGGARIVGELFCRAWEMEYQKFIRYQHQRE